MWIASGIRPPEGHNIETSEVAEGMYVVTNAYEGTSHYFRDDPAKRVPDHETAQSSPSADPHR